MHAQFMPWPGIAQPLCARRTLALSKSQGYSATVAANSATGCGSPFNSRRTSAIVSKAGAFFVPAVSFYGGCAQGALGRAGFLEFRSSTPVHRHRPSCGSDAGGSSTLGAVPMKHSHALNPSALQQHAASLKARAFAALHADSSLSVRLARYNTAMARARALEAEGVRHA